MWQLDKAVFRSLNLAGTNAARNIFIALFTVLGATYVLPLMSVLPWIRGKKDWAVGPIVLIVIVSLLAGLIKLTVAPAVIKLGNESGFYSRCRLWTISAFDREPVIMHESAQGPWRSEP